MQGVLDDMIKTFVQHVNCYSLYLNLSYDLLAFLTYLLCHYTVAASYSANAAISTPVEKAKDNSVAFTIAHTHYRV